MGQITGKGLGIGGMGMRLTAGVGNGANYWNGAWYRRHGNEANCGSGTWYTEAGVWYTVM